MSILTFDTYAAVTRLKEVGFSEAQAKGVVDTFKDVDASSLATKADIREVETKLEANDLSTKAYIREVETRLEAKIEASAANLKVDILRWLVITQITLCGFLFAALHIAK